MPDVPLITVTTTVNPQSVQVAVCPTCDELPCMFPRGRLRFVANLRLPVLMPAPASLKLQRFPRGSEHFAHQNPGASRVGLRIEGALRPAVRPPFFISRFNGAEEALRNFIFFNIVAVDSAVETHIPRRFALLLDPFMFTHHFTPNCLAHIL